VDRCDACGARVPGQAARATGGGQAAARPQAPARGRMDSTAIMMLLVGLVVGGAVGYALRSASSPGGDSGGAMGPSDLMSGPGGTMSPGGTGTEGMGAGMGGGMGGAMGGSPMAMSGEIMKMVEDYRARLAKNPKDVEALVGLGNLYFDSAQWPRAIEHYEKALEVDPKNADARVDLGICLHSTGDNERAVKEMERVTRENPGHKNAWFNLGVVEMASGDNKAAIRAWEQFLKLDPNGERSASLREELERLKKVP